MKKSCTDLTRLVLSLPQPSTDSGLDALAADFVAATSAPAVKSACVPTETPPQVELEPCWPTNTL